MIVITKTITVGNLQVFSPSAFDLLQKVMEKSRNCKNKQGGLLGTRKVRFEGKFIRVY